MSVFVLDASVVAKWFAREPFADQTSLLLDDRHQLHAPDFLLIEMDNILATWVRRGALTRSAAAGARTTLRRCPLQLHEAAALLDPAWTIALHTRSSIYDSLYVALAAFLKAKLVTADRKLLDALAPTPFSKHLLWIESVI
jgi:predicted nucleic acid-binding protein